MIWVIFSFAMSLVSFERSERSSTTCVVVDERGSSPIARCFCSLSSFMTALPRKPLAPVTRVISSVMRVPFPPAHSRESGNPEILALGPRFRGDERQGIVASQFKQFFSRGWLRYRRHYIQGRAGSRRYARPDREAAK